MWATAGKVLQKLRPPLRGKKQFFSALQFGCLARHSQGVKPQFLNLEMLLKIQGVFLIWCSLKSQVFSVSKFWHLELFWWDLLCNLTLRTFRGAPVKKTPCMSRPRPSLKFKVHTNTSTSFTTKIDFTQGMLQGSLCKPQKKGEKNEQTGPRCS